MGSLADLFVTVRPDVNRVPSMMNRSGQQAGQSFNDGFKSRLKGMVKGAAIATVVAAGAAIGTALTKGFKRLDAIDAARGKLVGLGHSAKEVDKIMASALGAVKGTAFGLDEAATVAASAVAAGIKPGRELERELRLVADAATIGGTSMGEMGAIFNQVKTSNKVFNDTLNQLGDRGIPIVQLLAKTMHVSAGSVTELAAAGKISFADFQKALEQGVGGAALASGKTFQGAMKNMFAALSRLGAGLLSGVFPQLKEGLGGLTKILDGMQPAANRAGAAIGNVVRGIRGIFDLLVRGNFGKNFHDAFNVQEDAPIVGRLLKVRSMMKQGIETAKLFFRAINGEIAGTVEAPKWIEVIVAAGVKIGTALDLIKLKVKVFWDAIWDPPAVDPTTSGFAQAQGAAFSLKDTLTGLINFVRANFLPALSAIATFILGTVVPAWVEWYTFLASNIMPIIKQVADFVQANFMPAFRAVSTFIVTQVVPAFMAIKTAVMELLRVVIPIVAQIVGGLISKFTEMKPQIMDIWNSIKDIITGVMFIIKEVIQAVTFIIGGIWARWGDKIMAVVKTIFGAMIGIIGGAMKIIAGVIKLFVALIKGDWSGAWNAIKQIFAGVWQVIKSILKLVLVFIQAAWVAWLAKIKSLWNAAWTAIKKVGSDAINSVKNTIISVLGKIRDGFAKGVGAIGTAWNKIRDVAKKPVEFVITTVLDKGILGAVRSISNFVNYGPGKNVHVGLPAGWARGTSAVLPGYTPGRDVHDFFSPTGGRLKLSGGEGIAVPQVVRAVGKKAWDQMNSDALHGKLNKAMGLVQSFAQGGSFFGGTSPVPGSWHRHSGYSWARWAGDNPVGMNTPVHAWKSGIIAAVRHLRTSYGNHIIENVGGARAYYAHLARAVVHAGQSVNQGQVIGYSDSTGNSTGPHLHFEIRGGNAAIGSAGGGGGGSFLQALSPAKWLKMITGALGKLKGIKNTPFGGMVAAAAEKIADGVKSKVTSLAASFMVAVKGAAGSAFTAITGGSNRAIGRRMMLQRWGANQWPALNSLWTRESGWNTHALNRSSGAYGIPQSLPASKMASAGSDWRNNPATQIKWGLGYIASRYGSPAAAWRHSQATNWYGKGGLIEEPVLGVGLRTGASYGFGEKGNKELVTPLPKNGGAIDPGVAKPPPRPVRIELDLGEDLRYIVQGVIDDDNEFHETMGRLSR